MQKSRFWTESGELLAHPLGRKGFHLPGTVLTSVPNQSEYSLDTDMETGRNVCMANNIQSDRTLGGKAPPRGLDQG